MRNSHVLSEVPCKTPVYREFTSGDQFAQDRLHHQRIFSNPDHIAILEKNSEFSYLRVWSGDASQAELDFLPLRASLRHASLPAHFRAHNVQGEMHRRQRDAPRLSQDAGCGTEVFIERPWPDPPRAAADACGRGLAVRDFVAVCPATPLRQSLVQRIPTRNSDSVCPSCWHALGSSDRRCHRTEYL